MSDLEDAFQAAEDRDRTEAARRERVTRLRQLKRQREEAIDEEANFRFFDRLMRETPHR